MFIFDRSARGQVAQGDITLAAVESAPTSASTVQPQSGMLVVAHSETGHHHGVSGALASLLRGEDPLTCYLVVDGEHADLVHHRSVNPHETIRLPRGAYRIRRQREWTPEGWRRVDD